jgi:DNA-binding NarL/FixJ family response regulator
MKNRIQISLYAASPARRSRLLKLATKDHEHRAIAVAGSLEALRHLVSDKAAHIVIVIGDLATPSEAAAFVRFLEHSPPILGAVALIDAPEARWVGAALAAGANAIITREPSSDELWLALNAAEAGMVLLHPSSARALTAGSLRPQAFVDEEDEVEELTARERQVLRLLGDGLGNKEIAARLAISEHTAKFHISSILGKLSAASRTEAVSQGIRRGLIPI